MAVLVVDDAGIMRMILRDILVRYGNFEKGEIFEAVDGNDAILKYKAHSPEFVLCDIAMPDMNGIEVVRVLKEFDPDVKIIMCTASTDQSDVRECIRAGAKDYVIKPPKPERVIQAIESVTGRSFIEKEKEKEKEEPVLIHDGGSETASGKPLTVAPGVAVTRDEFEELKQEFVKLNARFNELKEKLG